MNLDLGERIMRAAVVVNLEASKSYESGNVSASISTACSVNNS